MKTTLPLSLAILFQLCCGCAEKDTRDPLLIKADAGDAMAQFEWAEGKRLSGDLDEAIVWYEKSITNNYEPARIALMRCYASGEAGAEFISEGVRLAHSLSQSGNHDAMVLYGRALLSGEHVEQDSAKAEELFEQLVAARHPYGLYWEAKIALEEAGESMDLSKKRGWQSQVKKSAEAGVREAQYLLGLLLEEQHENSEADKWYLEAANQGHIGAIFKMGIAYRRLGNHPRYAPLAFEYLSQAAAAGVEAAIFPLAHSYVHGVGTATEKDLGMSWMQVGAALRQFDCVEFLLKTAYLDPEWDRREKVDVGAWLMLADDLDEKMVGAIRAKLFPTDSLFHDEVDYRLEQFDLEARKFRSGFNPSVQELNESELRKLESRFSQRYGEYESLYLKVVEEWDADSMLRLAQLCMDPEQSFYDLKEAFYWIDRAIEDGKGEAGLWVYQSFLGGDPEGITESKAVLYLDKAAHANLPEAQYLYALELIEGRRMKQDYEEAIRFLASADALGHEQAKRVATDLIRSGNGIEPRKFFRPVHSSNPIVRRLGRETVQVLQSKVSKRDPTVFTWNIIEELAEEGIPEFEFMWAESEIRKYETAKKFSSFVPVSTLSNYAGSRTARRNGAINYSFPNRNRNYMTLVQNSTREGELSASAITAEKKIKELAESGYPEAQLIVSGWKLFGFYSKQDEAVAVSMWKAMADSDEPTVDGTYLWGYALFRGFNCQKDVLKGVDLIRTAADAGQESAQSFFSDYNSGIEKISFLEHVYQATALRKSDSMLELAWHFKDNDSYPEAYAAAQYLKWVSEAAKEGSLLALRAIGGAYMKGDLVEKNPLRAIRFLEQAAKAGDSQAQYDVGFHYSTGEHITEDFEKAERYLRMSAEQGFQQAVSLVATLDSLNRDSGIEGSAFRNAVVSNALRIDFFPIKPLVLNAGELLPVVGVKSKYPVYATAKGNKTAKKKDRILYFAAEKFGAGKISVPKITIAAPIVKLDNGWVYTGNDPSVTINCQADSAMNDIYFLVVIKDYQGDFHYHWRPIGDMVADKIYKEKVKLDELDLFFDASDIAIFFFSEGMEIVNESRVQLQYFLNKDLRQFPKDRTAYLEDKRDEELPPKLYDPIPYAQFGDLEYPSGLNATFSITELGFVSELELPNDLTVEVKERLFELFGQIRFLPRLENGKPTPSRARIAIQ